MTDPSSDNSGPEVSEVLRARDDFEYFATHDEFIDQSHYPGNQVVIKDFHKEWIDALENNDRLAITAFTGSGKCLAPNTKIPMADGSWKEVIDVEPGDEILSLNTEEMSIEPSEVSRFYVNGVKKTYKVRTRNGKEIVVTDNHPFYSVDGWKSLEQGLSEGDFVAQPDKEHPHAEESELSSGEAMFLGLIVAEGGLSTGYPKFSNADDEIIQTVKSIISKEWDAELVKISDDACDYRIVNSERTKGVPNRVKNFLSEHGLMEKTAHDKHVPQAIFDAPAHIKTEFLAGLWAGDGYVSKGSSWEVSLCMCNKELLQDVQLLFDSLGIRTNLSYKCSTCEEEKFDSWRLCIETPESVTKAYNLLDIPLQRKTNRWYELSLHLTETERNTNTEVVPVRGERIREAIDSYNEPQGVLADQIDVSAGLLSMYKNDQRNPSKRVFKKLAKETADEELLRYVSDDVRWDKIESIEYIGEQETYDITVPDNHSFIGNGFITHNTTVPAALYILWKIFQNPGDFDALIVSDTLDQSKKILAEIKHHIEEAEYLNDLYPDNKDTSWARKMIETTEGNKVQCRPYGEQVKGVHADYIICDESAEFNPHEIYFRFVRTRAASRGGTVCLISTPVHENDLMAKLSDGQKSPECPSCGTEVTPISEDDNQDNGDYYCENEMCDRIEVDSEDIIEYDNISEKGYWSKTYPVFEEVEDQAEASDEAFHDKDRGIVDPLFPENFDEESIKSLREEDPIMFQKEYLCQALSVEGDMYDPNDVLELYDKDLEFHQNPEEDAKYYMGVDLAVSKQGDYSVYTVLEVPQEGKPRICYMERIRGMGLDEQESRIEELHGIFKFNKIVVDKTNFGARTYKNLLQSGLPVEGQSFEMRARSGLLTGLKNDIENKKFKIPRGGDRAKQLTDKLYNELLGFGTTETESGTVTYKSTAAHDDTVMSLAMVANTMDTQREVQSIVAHN